MTIYKASCESIYKNDFFRDFISKKLQTRRFRAVVQNLNFIFVKKVWVKDY